MNYIRPTQQEAINLNNILYTALVTDDGVNFKFPYQRGTTSYIDVNRLVYPVDGGMLSISELIGIYLVNQKTEAEARAACWIQEGEL